MTTPAKTDNGCSRVPLERRVRTHHPKGGMCVTCAKRFDDCHGLGFENMPVIRTEDGISIVRCTQHVRSNVPHEGPGAASSRTVTLDAVVGPLAEKKG